LENNHSVHFYTNTDSEISNNIYNNVILEEININNEIKKNNNNSLNVYTDFKNTTLFKYILDYSK
jgi:hypothetical protein